MPNDEVLPHQCHEAQVELWTDASLLLYSWNRIDCVLSSCRLKEQEAKWSRHAASAMDYDIWWEIEPCSVEERTTSRSWPRNRWVRILKVETEGPYFTSRQQRQGYRFCHLISHSVSYCQRSQSYPTRLDPWKLYLWSRRLPRRRRRMDLHSKIRPYSRTASPVL